MNDVIDRWHASDAYERYMGRWSRRLAPRFLQWLGMPPGQRWLDVGCGTGALSEAILALAPRSVIGVDPSEGFLAAARSRLPASVALHRAPAAALPVADDAVDVAASALVLNFVPDAQAALAEMVRVTCVGGTVAAAVWDYAGRMALVRTYWDAVAQLDPEARALDQGERFPLCQPAALRALFEGAGLRGVVVSALEMALHFDDFDDYWLPFLGGQGSAPTHAMSLDPLTRERLRERIRANIVASCDGSITMSARAWVVQGSVGA